MRTDRIVDTVSVYNSECMGCERVERDIMVTFVCDPTMFEDFFLTQEQAIYLRDQLNKQIEYNWQNLPIEERRESKIENILK
jgi:hypothetical protein